MFMVIGVTSGFVFEWADTISIAVLAVLGVATAGLSLVAIRGATRLADRVERQLSDLAKQNQTALDAANDARSAVNSLDQGLGALEATLNTLNRLRVTEQRATGKSLRHFEEQCATLARSIESLATDQRNQSSELTRFEEQCATLARSIESLATDQRNQSSELTRTVHSVYRRQTGRSVSNV